MNPLPQGNELNDIQFVGDSLVIAVGDFGTFIKSENAGQTWSYQHLLYRNLNCLYFYSALDGYIGGVNGLVLKTNDGGKTWNTINSKINESIIDIYYQSTKNALIILTNSQMLRTTNNGINWQILATGSFTQFDFPDDSTGWVCGTEIMKSTNSGLNWNTVYNIYHTGKSLSFINDTTGYVIINYPEDGSENFIMKTTDGGKQWIKQNFPNEFTYGIFIKSLDINFAFMFGILNSNPYVYRTTNGGEVWNKYSINYGDIRPTISAIAFNKNGTGIGVGSPYKRQAIIYTYNWGENWNTKNELTEILNGVSILSSDRWIVAGGGKVFLTADAGKTWNIKLNLGETYYVDDLNFYKHNFGIVLVNSSIYISHDGGDSFKEINNISHEINVSPIFTSVDLVNDSLAWIAGSLYIDNLKIPEYKGAIFKTDNSGESWTTIEFPDYDRISSVYFFNSNRGFVSAHDKILKTLDGGKTWSTVFQTSGDLIKLDFGNDGIGWGVDRNGQIIKSSDYGDSWDYQKSNLPVDTYTDLKVINNQTEIALSSWQTIISTTDGGNTWHSKNLPAKNISKVDYKYDFGLAIGYYGYIIKFNWSLITSVNNPVKLYKVNNFIIKQNYPNPFNPSTKMNFSIPQSENVMLKIYDVLGRQITTLVNEEKPAGNYTLEFDGSNLPSGVYFYQIHAGDFIETKKMLLLK